ncbi:Zinc finger BED domain-containing protein DAYSLEEPER [Fusarium oxysporum f. sp. albedinis]|nr:Zinc finger BED domain-containing protein DAYSLEEPER [Fusarium oxysporum f. sp. albedinis]
MSEGVENKLGLELDRCALTFVVSPPPVIRFRFSHQGPALRDPFHRLVAGANFSLQIVRRPEQGLVLSLASSLCASETSSRDADLSGYISDSQSSPKDPW